MKKSGYALLVFLLLISPVLHGQDFSIELLRKKFNAYRENNILEKIYIQTDRELYLTGELVWIKVSCVDGSFHKPLNMSQVVYIELLNRDNEAVEKLKISLKNGFGEGSFFLSAALPSDNYLLRAYTSWMKNSDPDFYFHKIISVVNPFIDPELKIQAPTLEVTLFPEGGNLVNGLTSKVGFKVSSHTVEGIDFQGSLLDDTNDTLLHFKPSKFGIGNFEFRPSKTKKYRVSIKAKGFPVTTREMPLVQSSGYVVRVSELTEMISVDLTYAGESSNNEDITLFIHTRNTTPHLLTKRMSDQKVHFEFRKGEMPEGVSHFTVFNSKGEPVCERLFFKQPAAAASVITKINKEEFGLREKITLQIGASANIDQPLSVTILKVDSLQAENNRTLADYLWLTSDLGNLIESPSYYFSNANESASAIDNLMLTQNWRKFNWKNILKDTASTISFFPESRGHVLQAKVTGTDGQPTKGITVFLSSIGKINMLHTSHSDEKGNVSFELNDFYGKHKVLTQTNLLVDSTSSIEILEPFSSQFATFKLPDLKVNTLEKTRLLERSIRMQLQNIFFEEHENSFRAPSIDSAAFYYKADEIYQLDEYTRFPVMEEVMREYIAGVVVRKRKDSFYFYLLDKKVNKLFNDPPLVLLDGVPIFKTNEIMAFSPLKVKRIEVVTHKYFLGPSEFYGIVSYYTYQGDLGGFTLRSKNKLVDYQGLQIPRKFYHPTYPTQPTNNRTPDPRYLLYWNPSYTISPNANNEIDFFSSDVPGQYRIVIEGITSSGQAIYSSTHFQVKKH